MPGWTGDVCDVPICKKGCDPLQGYCKRPGECRCKLGNCWFFFFLVAFTRYKFCEVSNFSSDLFLLSDSSKSQSDGYPTSILFVRNLMIHPATQLPVTLCLAIVFRYHLIFYFYFFLIKRLMEIVWKFPAFNYVP